MDSAERPKRTKLSREEKDAICPGSERWDDGCGKFDYTRKNVNKRSVSYQCSHNRKFKCRATLNFDRSAITDTNPTGFYLRSTGRIDGLHTRSCVVRNGCDPDDPATMWDGKLESNPFLELDEQGGCIPIAGELVMFVFCCVSHQL